MLRLVGRAATWRPRLDLAGCPFCTGGRTEAAPHLTGWEHPSDSSPAEVRKTGKIIGQKIKATHGKLRSDLQRGKKFQEIWSAHSKDVAHLSDYAANMLFMAQHWERLETSLKNRNTWIEAEINNYYFEKRNLILLQEEIRKANLDPSVLTPSQQELLGDLQQLLRSQEQQELKKCPQDKNKEQGQREGTVKLGYQEVARAAGPAQALPGASPMAEALVYTESAGGVRQLGAASRVRVLDVGSCYNPLGQYPGLLVTPIDLMPAAEDVYKCDFLEVEVVEEEEMEGLQRGRQIEQLPRQHYDVVVFSLVLDYIPCPEARLRCCRKAHQLLRPGGLLLIVTPSSSSSKNTRLLIKYKQLQLARVGFERLSKRKNGNHSTYAYRKSFFQSLCSTIETKKVESNIKGLKNTLKIANKYNDELDKLELEKGVYFASDLQSERT